MRRIWLFLTIGLVFLSVGCGGRDGGKSESHPITLPNTYKALGVK